MSNELSKTEHFTPEQIQLITNTIAKGATPDELQLFLYRCRHLGLDPLKPGQIHFIKYSSGPGSIVIGIEGFRSRAASTGKLAGIKRGALKDSKGALLGAYAEVYRSDWKECAREEVPLSEYNTGKGPWAKMPETMIKKVAEAAALRMAFPDDLGGVYTKEEMDQAEMVSHRVTPEDPGTDGHPPSDTYRIMFGKYKQKTLEQVMRDEGPDAIAGYINYLEESAQKQNKPIQGQVLEFIERAGEFLASWENSSEMRT
jgi:phage recombination protein Bet